MMEGLSAKVFRTYNASITLQKQLYEKTKDINEVEPLDKKIDFYNVCNLDVARLCNHQKAVAKNFNE
jgi:DNA topoisomerase-1